MDESRVLYVLNSLGLSRAWIRSATAQLAAVKVAIMQPYFMPYLGYWQVISAVDVFVVYDDIKYTKKGWINRNRFLQNGTDAQFSLPLKKGSDCLDVVDRELAADFSADKLLNQFRGAYARAPFRRELRPLLERILCFEEINLFRYIHHSIMCLCKHLGLNTKIVVSSQLPIDHGLKTQEKVLAVGDAEFQKKCLGKMQDVAGHGRTILFVSHNMVAVQSLCTRALYLDQGTIRMNGPVRQVISDYLRLGGCVASERSWPDHESAPGNEFVCLNRVGVSAAGPAAKDPITMQDPVRIFSEYARLRPGREVHLTLHLVNEDDVVVLTTGTGRCPDEPGGYRASCDLPGNLLNSGGYRLPLLVVEDGSRVVSVEESIGAFSITDTRERSGGWMGREPSAVAPPLDWSLQTVESEIWSLIQEPEP